MRVEVAAADDRAAAQLPGALDVSVFMPRLPYGAAKGVPVLRPASVLTHMAASPTRVRSWVSAVEWLPEVAAEATADDVLELDEMWSFVRKKDQARWLWTAMCRRTRQIVAFAIGDRSKATCLRLWQAIPHEYKHCHTFSDFWHAYQYVFPAETHHCVGKETGETAHMERWNNTLRQRVGRYVRQTLSFSKSDESHEMVTKWFIVQYNLGLSLTI